MTLEAPQPAAAPKSRAKARPASRRYLAIGGSVVVTFALLLVASFAYDEQAGTYSQPYVTAVLLQLVYETPFQPLYLIIVLTPLYLAAARNASWVSLASGGLMLVGMVLPFARFLAINVTATGPDPAGFHNSLFQLAGPGHRMPQFVSIVTLLFMGGLVALFWRPRVGGLIGLTGVITMIFVWPAVYDEPPTRGGEPEVVFFGRGLLFGYYVAWVGAVVGLLGQWTALLLERYRRGAPVLSGPAASAVCLALGVVVAAGCGGSGRPPIAFISDRDGNPEVYVLQGQTGDVRRLTSTPDDREMSPAISPDGKLVAFLSTLGSGETALWVVEIDGRDPRRIGGPPGERVSFAWSPDSKRIAYEVATPGRGTDIYVSDLDGRKTIPVTSEPGTDGLGAWSKDGQWLVYSLAEGPRQGINRKNPDGVNEIRLSERSDVGPKWSPDGTRVAFMSKRDAADYDIYVVDINGNREQNVTSAGGNDTDFDWSPDSRRIVFVSDRHGNPEVYMQAIGRQEAVRLTTNNAREVGPRWSKDGREILFVSDADGDYDLYVMRPDGTRQERLTLNSADDTSASW